MRALEFLVEYNRDITLQRYKDKLASAATQDHNQSVDEVISQLEEMDPTKNKQYVQWLVIQYIKGQFRTEDSSRVNTLLMNFVKLKPRLDQKDINRYDFYQLDEKIDAILNPELAPVNRATPVVGTFPVVPDSEVLYNGPLGQLAIPETEEASCELGKGTKWCTAAIENNRFRNYRESPLYIWRDRNGDKFQFYFGYYPQVMDARDRPITKKQINYFRTEHPVLKKLFALQENAILQDPETAYKYANSIIDGRWPEGEKVIATDPIWALVYAKDVIKGRWPEVEHIIATDSQSAYQYARTVIKGRWPEGEKAIAAHPGYSYIYAKDVIKGRFPAGEVAIATDAEHSYYYAKNVIKGRFPAGEAIIKTNPQLWAEYTYLVK